jgi:hypothetical protein
VSAYSVSWREKAQNWQVRATCLERQSLGCLPAAASSATVGPFATDRKHLLKIDLNDYEKRAVGRLLADRKARLIETTEDTTQPDTSRRAGSIEWSVVESILGKLRFRGLTSTRASGKRLGAAETFPATHKRSGRAL